jgi:adenylate kinase
MIILFSNPFGNDIVGFFLLQLKEIVNQGKLVSDEIIINLLSKRLKKGEEQGESGFILDGFPRTVNQAVSIFYIYHESFLLLFILGGRTQ